jgi:transcriptional regulator with XRE-family HTH domain
MIRERIIKLIIAYGFTNDELEEKTGISSGKWANLRTRKQRANEDHITAICKIYPEYAYWITTGKELPESGQISPMTKQASEKLNLKAG